MRSSDRPSRYRALRLKDGREVTGYYFEMPETSRCFSSDPEPETRYFLVDYMLADWGLPNEPVMWEIDISTLKEIED